LSTKYEGIGILTDLFNQIKNKKMFPFEWKTTIICPTGHYRGISLLSVFGEDVFGDRGWQAKRLAIEP
jgi:hypothetical protein